jgi:hypothetical protein
MRARLLTATILISAATFALAGSGPAWAADPGGQYGWTNAQASGGQLTVQAGHTYWTPPAGSSWAKTAQSEPLPGKASPNQPYDCTYQADPEALQTLGAGGATPGQWVIPTCAGPGVIDPMPPVWVANPAQVAVQVNPVVVGQQAVKQLAFASPTIEMAPPSGSPQLVGVAAWLWIDPGAWKTLSASATAGPVTATATATPSKVVWDLGDGSTVTCDGPGTPYNPSEPNASTACSYTWPQAGSYTVTATVYWSVSWTAVGAAGGGNLGLQAGPAAEVPVMVTESQAINTLTGGSN